MPVGHSSATTSQPDPARSHDRPAPDDLEVLRGFVNTEIRAWKLDVLVSDDPRCPHFLTLLLPGFDAGRLDTRARRRLVPVRRAVRALFEGAPGAEAELTRIAARFPLRVALTGGVGGPGPSSTLTAVGDGPEHELVAAVLSALHSCAQDGRIDRFRLCERPECAYLFYDGTRNRSARWCSSDPCGSVMKARAYRARERRAG